MTETCYPKEYRIIALRECPIPKELMLCDTPNKVAEYWNLHLRIHPYVSPDCENFVVLFLNTRRCIKGHHLVSIGTLDTLLVHPREVFRIAIIAGGVSAIILAHNHPSSDPTPSEADIKVTKDLIRAGQILKIEVLDHVILGGSRYLSLREQGYFFD